eukprot:scaffold9872_cov79-Isochrysis_galbana.AAC.2
MTQLGRTSSNRGCRDVLDASPDASRWAAVSAGAPAPPPAARLAVPRNSSRSRRICSRCASAAALRSAAASSRATASSSGVWLDSARAFCLACA